MSVYTQFSFGGLLGDSFVRDNGDGTQTLFFYEPSGVITTREYSVVRELAAGPGIDLDDLVRTFQYHTLNDGVMDYAFAVGADYHIEVTDILGDGDDDKTYNGFNHFIEGHGGNDLLYAGDGQNQVYGGDGHDVLSAGEHSDIILGNSGNDSLFGSSGQDYVFGGHDDDYVSGGPEADILSGGRGDDEIRGGLGSDIIFDLAGDNQVHGEAGEDYIITGDGADEIWGNEDADIIHSGAGIDKLHGGGGDDLLFAEDGHDRVYAGTGNDVVYGGPGDDYLEGEGGDDILYGGQGSDEIKGGSGNDRLYADDGPAGTDVNNDKLRGGSHDDQLYGGGGKDYLYGDEGRDLLVGRSYGQSVMTGGADADTFAFDGLNSGHHAHRIEDLQANDFINVSDVLEGYDALTSDISDFIMLVFRDDTRTDIKVSVEGTGHGWQSLAVMAGDFTGVTAETMLASGQLIADHKLFAEDV